MFEKTAKQSQAIERKKILRPSFTDKQFLLREAFQDRKITEILY